LLLQQLKQAFSFEKGTRIVLSFSLAATALLSGLGFAIRDFERVNPIISFIAGCATGPLIILLPFVSLLAGIALSCWVFGLLGYDLRSEEQAFAERRRLEKTLPTGVASALGLVFAGLLYLAAIEIASTWCLPRLSSSFPPSRRAPVQAGPNCAPLSTVSP
jgi:hypothetical protein